LSKSPIIKGTLLSSGTASTWILALYKEPLAGCSDKKGSAQKAGEKADNAAEKAGDAVKGAAEKTKDAVGNTVK
jgi:hypothetical protein